MSPALTQKLGSLQAAEKELGSSLSQVLSQVSQEKLTQILKSVQESSSTRTSTLESVASLLKAKLESQPNPAVSGVIKELTQSTSASGTAADINLATSLQKLLSLLLADYSFAANMAYEQKAPAQAINPLIEQYQQLLLFNIDVTNITVDLFRQLGESSTGSPPASQQPSSQPQPNAQQQSSSQPQSSSQQLQQSNDSQKQKSGLLYDAREKIATAAEKVSQSIKPE